MTKTRKIQQIVNSYYVALPPKWVKGHELKKGDELEMTHDDDSVTFKIKK
jgi:phosphate uptake regulator